MLSVAGPELGVAHPLHHVQAVPRSLRLQGPHFDREPLDGAGDLRQIAQHEQPEQFVLVEIIAGHAVDADPHPFGRGDDAPQRGSGVGGQGPPLHPAHAEPQPPRPEHRYNPRPSASRSARSTFSGFMGSLCMRMPTAS